jgi:hypothetical protein
MQINDISFTNQSEQLIYGMADGVVKVWDAKLRRHTRALKPAGSY